MSKHDYMVSRQLDAELQVPFYAIIMLAMRRADTANLAMLKASWPRVWGELEARYNAPGGLLPDEPA